MRFDELLHNVADEPVFSSSLLMSPGASAISLERQLSRWNKAGKIHQLRRGLYALAKPYQKVAPHPFLLANLLKSASYVSLQSALAYHGMIPEYVPTVTSVTTERPEELETPLGHFAFRHVKKSFFWGYSKLALVGEQTAFVASPEKAFLDLVYLTPGADDITYLEELRLQNLEVLQPKNLIAFAERSDSPKLIRVAKNIVQLAEAEEGRTL